MTGIALVRLVTLEAKVATWEQKRTLPEHVRMVAAAEVTEACDRLLDAVESGRWTPSRKWLTAAGALAETWAAVGEATEYLEEDVAAFKRAWREFRRACGRGNPS